MNRYMWTSLGVAAVVLASCSSSPADEALEPLERVIAGDSIAAPQDSPLAPFEVRIDRVAIVEASTPTAIPRPTVVPTSTPRPSAAATAAPEPSPTPQPDPEPTPCRRFVLHGPTFESNRADLSGPGLQVLARLVTALEAASCGVDSEGNECPRGRLQISTGGHTDDQLTSLPGGNQQLSLDRAQIVADFFDHENFTIRGVRGFADSVPAPAPSPENRSLEQVRRDNRRTEIYLWCSA